MIKNKFIPFAFAFLLITGCAVNDKNNGGEKMNSKNSNAVNIISINAKELQQPEYGQQNPESVKVANGANDFAFKLSSALAKQSGDRNFICSPYLVWLPLAALLNATDADNKANLLDALGASGVREMDVNNAASRMLYDLTKQREKGWAKEYGEQLDYDPLKIANIIFVSRDVTLKKEFAQIFMDYYRGTAMNVDFRSQDAVDIINKWASDNTDGLITDIVQEFNPDTVAALANAIYFSDRWDWEFDPNKTKEDPFYSPTGEKKAFYMIREGDDELYYEDEKIQAMPIEFKMGGGMYIILPKDGNATELLSTMTNEHFNQIQTNSVLSTGKLLLPRFSIEGNVMELKDVLKSLGVPLFNETIAPLTSGLIDEQVPVWLSSAVHKAVIKVDEKGTTAAAVTVMVAAAESTMPIPLPTDPFEMNCNKPFVFILYGNTYDGGNQILFTGSVNQP